MRSCVAADGQQQGRSTDRDGGSGSVETDPSTPSDSGSAPAAAGGPRAERDFAAMLGALEAWVEEYGSCHVPSGVHDQRALARWVQRVRRLGRRGGTSKRSGGGDSSGGSGGGGGGSGQASEAGLTAEQRTALDALGFVWKPNQVRGDKAGSHRKRVAATIPGLWTLALRRT